jgi:hypothetical protein
MKTKQEIEQLAEKECTHHFDLRIGYFKGYTQCQKDMIDIRYTEEDVINALHSVELKNNKDYSKIYEGMKEYFNSLNKQE